MIMEYGSLYYSTIYNAGMNVHIHSQRNSALCLELTKKLKWLYSHTQSHKQWLNLIYSVYTHCYSCFIFKPTLFLALCPESSFPLSHPATWTRLRHAERTRIPTERAATPAADREQTPIKKFCQWPRTIKSTVFWRIQTSQQTREGMI